MSTTCSMFYPFVVLQCTVYYFLLLLKSSKCLALWAWRCPRNETILIKWYLDILVYISHKFYNIGIVIDGQCMQLLTLLFLLEWFIIYNMLQITSPLMNTDHLIVMVKTLFPSIKLESSILIGWSMATTVWYHFLLPWSISHHG